MMMEEECPMENSLGCFAELSGSLSSSRTNNGINNRPGQSRYAQLLAVIEELGKDIRPTYAGSKSSAERLKRGIIHAKILVQECLMETERSARHSRMSMLVKKAVFAVDLCADSTEWCPVDDYANLFVCGTYQLSDIKENSEETNKRLGSLYFFQFTDASSGFLKLLQQISMPGILDCKWCHIKLQDNVFLALVNAVGELRLFKLKKKEDAFYLSEVQNVKMRADSNPLLLSLDWSTGVTSFDVKIIVSSSTGDIAIFVYNDGLFFEDSCWNLHRFEAWIVAFNYWDANIFFSGGDDCRLHCFDVRVGRTISSNSIHTAGVTSLQMNYKDEYNLISGSYDERILFWDIRNMKTPLKNLNVGGGVWRLKWEPKMCNYICAACMYYGSIVVNAVNTEVIAEYKEHRSINYGIDWSSLPEEKICQNLEIDKNESFKYNLIAVCSFYDNLLSLALVQTPK